MLIIRSCEYRFFVANVVGCLLLSSCSGEPKPEAYGWYARNGRALVLLPAVSKVVSHRVNRETVLGISGAPEIVFASPETDFLIFSDNISGRTSEIEVTRLRYEPGRVDTRKKEFIFFKTYVCDADVPVTVQPIDGEPQMFNFMPSSPLEPGIYAFHTHGFCGGGNPNNLEVRSFGVWPLMERQSHVTTYDLILETAKYSCTAPRSLVEDYANAGKGEKAKEVLRLVLARIPECLPEGSQRDEELYNLLLCCLDVGWTEEARDLLSDLESSYRLGEARASVMAALAKKGEVAEAEKLLDLILNDRSGGLPMSDKNIGKLCASLALINRGDDVQAVVDSFCQSDQSVANARHFMVDLLREWKLTEEVVQWVKHWTENGPALPKGENTNLAWHAAYAFAEVGNTTSADSWLDRVVEDQYATIVETGVCVRLAKSGKLDEALSRLNRLSHPVWAQWRIGHDLAEQGEPFRAYDLVKDLGPYDYDGTTSETREARFASIAILCADEEDSGRLTEVLASVTTMENGTSEWERQVELRLARVKLLSELERFSEAEALNESASFNRERHQLGWAFIATAYHGVADATNAERCLMEALSIGGTSLWFNGGPIDLATSQVVMESGKGLVFHEPR